MNEPKYRIGKNGEFVIENYNLAPTFASFFPGIAGIYGCPMWVFYANRGQCITSAGIQDKDGSIIEFQPANKAFRSVSLSGFRTFLKINGKFYEPFKNSPGAKNQMRISPHSLTIKEENSKTKLRVEVTYFTIANDSFPALARKVKITNLSNKKREIELIDGLPIIIPYGFTYDLLKKISQTTAAWCMVGRLKNDTPYFRLKVAPADICETEVLEKGHFFISFSSQGDINYVIEPTLVFGEDSSLASPDNFIQSKNFYVPKQQLSQGFIPCAFAHKKFKLGPANDFKLFSLIGQAESVSHLSKIRQTVSKPNYFENKRQENQKLINGIGCNMKTESQENKLDLYCEQTFLDNIMRGGVSTKIDHKNLYLFYRKHGDMERDYNNFNLMPTYFSQGNGNYRDINQNRRNDLFFAPEVGKDNIVRFMNLIQLDGFNPLVVLGSSFCVKDKNSAASIIKKHIKNPLPNLVGKICQVFVLGELLKTLDCSGTSFTTSQEAFVADLVNGAQIEESAQHGEGYWVDHFFYNIDLLESFECIYPEQIQALLFKDKILTFFDNDHVVHPRAKKYFLDDGKVRQYKSVEQDLEKSALINNRSQNKNLVRTQQGQGEIYYTTLIAKLLSLVANKAASFDPFGIGIEMEAGKPGWYDALNGLPALFGSSLPETFELKRLCGYILGHLSSDTNVALPIEIKGFIETINQCLTDLADPFSYWDKSYAVKENYRSQTKLGIKGSEDILDSRFVVQFLKNVIKKCDRGTQKCLKKYNNYCTYFINQAVEHEGKNGGIKIKKFKQTTLPLFLEGFVHALKVDGNKNIYKLVKKSPLYDKKLKMYKVNASLKDAPIEIGRAKIFTPGWLENESIWLHMQYKYMLEILKNGLHKEFFADFKNVFVPFMDPKKYKRSPLENSSFIVSSANPNAKNHGRGFVARLSGATAEFIDIWLYMMTGKYIFSLDKKGKLIFKLSPILPAWLFKNGKLSFNLFGSINVTYLNPTKKNTYAKGVKPISYKLTLEDGKEVKIDQSDILEPYSKAIRERKVKKIVVTLDLEAGD
ncbi:MAG: cellobiose phosphorylase [Candidatus Saganbacteria bacterium]|nr:cellobiose phosphorylase [Candidatus Saganbacteria bacterium]